MVSADAATENFAGDEQLAERAAYILGDHSAARQALSELARRRANGERAWIVYARGVWLVGPAASSGERGEG